MQKHKTRWLRVIIHGQEQLLECEEIKRNSLSLDHKPLCRCCSQELIGIADIIQWGFLEDRYLTVFVCEGCGKAFFYWYEIPCYNLSQDATVAAHPSSKESISTVQPTERRAKASTRKPKSYAQENL